MRLLGVIENMTGDVFGSGGGEELAADLGVPLLGTVPLDPRCASRATSASRSSPRIRSRSPRRRSSRSREEIEALRREPRPAIVKSLPLVG